MKFRFAIAVFACLFLAGRVWADFSHCAVCGEPMPGAIYVWEDKVANEKKGVCEKCSALPTCYLCGMPTWKDRAELPDGRILCARDSKTVVLDDEEALRICREVKDSLDRQISRFISIPDTNVTLAMVDRVNLIALFKIPGNDYSCPNVLGYTERRTNDQQTAYHISLLIGLQRPMLKATCAHEYSHVWINENVSDSRRKRLDPDSVEGFCELVSYVLMEAQGETAMLSVIKSNAYTRGQIDLFLAAGRRFGFNEIVDWMKYGVDGRLMEDDLGRVRDVELPAPTATPAVSVARVAAQVEPPPAPDILVLKGIVWSKKQPAAVINDRSLQVQEEAQVRLGRTNVLIRCVEVREDSVTIQIVKTGERQELRLKGR